MRNFISFYILIIMCFPFISCKDDTEIADFEVSEVGFDAKLRDDHTSSEAPEPCDRRRVDA